MGAVSFIGLNRQAQYPKPDLCLCTYAEKQPHQHPIGSHLRENAIIRFPDVFILVGSAATFLLKDPDEFLPYEAPPGTCTVAPIMMHMRSTSFNSMHSRTLCLMFRVATSAVSKRIYSFSVGLCANELKHPGSHHSFSQIMKCALAAIANMGNAKHCIGHQHPNRSRGVVIGRIYVWGNQASAHTLTTRKTREPPVDIQHHSPFMRSDRNHPWSRITTTQKKGGNFVVKQVMHFSLPIITAWLYLMAIWLYPQDIHKPEIIPEKQAIP